VIIQQFRQPFLLFPGDRGNMAMYELLERRIEENQTKPVMLYDLLEARIRDTGPTDRLWRLLALRIKERDENSDKGAS
jgi:hypothetical protein